jgi:large subunit ribosomal protein L13|uniref:Large ribosomal subunit protein uL13c n=1 Tax=Baffinella frigidus TaxID=2571260 RepID=A0A7T8G5Q2_9CRYP|nr:ribosomal protein L13 [Cryptophyta sp. CCMP2293]
MNKTIVETKKNTDYKWYLVDAESKTLGRLASEVSKILTGKNNPIYHPSQKIRNAVVVINSEKIQISGKKRYDKFYRRYSGYQGGMTIETFDELQKRIPSRIIEKSVKGMLPNGPLGRDLFTKLKVYKGENHPHIAQKPELVNI